MLPKKKRTKIRLYCDKQLSSGSCIFLEGEQAHYVRDVMRAKLTDSVVLFDGISGDWVCAIKAISRKGATLVVEALAREYVKTPALVLCIALIKPETMRNVIRQATELGVTVIQPVLTEYSSVRGVNIQKCRKWAIEAAEQCGRQDIPVINETMGFHSLKELGQQLIICDETGQGEVPAKALCGKENLAIVVGPEGGFSEEELLRAEGFAGRMTLGPRILRVDTAVVSALAYISEHILF